MLERIEKAADALRQRIGEAQVGVILGSGLGDYPLGLPGVERVSYGEIPGFPRSTVEGHAGEFACAAVGGVRALFMRGRFHPYEGYGLDEVTLPVRVMARLGVKTLIVTNAAGGVNTGFEPGDLMLIQDHVNFSENPLCGPNMEAFGPRFPDVSRAYDPELIVLARRIGGEKGINLRQGVYFYMRGPSYETPAEIRALRVLGADAVGMSTVHEVVAARHSGLGVLGICCISNMAAGVLDQPLEHEEVMRTAQRVKWTFAELLEGILRAL